MKNIRSWPLILLIATTTTSNACKAACPDGADPWLVLESERPQSFKVSTCSDGTTLFQGIDKVRVTGPSSYALTSQQLSDLRSAVRRLAQHYWNLDLKSRRREFNSSQGGVTVTGGPLFEVFTISATLDGRSFAISSTDGGAPLYYGYYSVLTHQDSFALRCPYTIKNDVDGMDFCKSEEALRPEVPKNKEK
jgi:hypothetical protein